MCTQCAAFAAQDVGAGSRSKAQGATAGNTGLTANADPGQRTGNVRGSCTAQGSAFAGDQSSLTACAQRCVAANTGQAADIGYAGDPTTS
ncbi:hypothetical protein LAUMK35_00629 [Mycobacterium pseudokansasii]|nr:hypothetical protein A4G27_16170 [Mycobacterium kansasii]VAZ88678.1 hypothetical protein LAUMK35_00629 [Mycobacterium pseudokansasii]